ncbi:MAG: cobalamin B12-binding domain-containing protein, partial [Thermodesulfobacteriota bacterium]|nr:cobalamin B12-binding domain-containing protein [Thermodesulfobacteriota bacterium]
MPKRVLLLYTDKYYLIKQVYPFGLDLIANYLRSHSHDVTIDFPYLASSDLETNLARILERTNPDLIGLGLRNIDTCMSCEQYGNYEGTGYRAFYFLPEVKQIVEAIKKFRPDVPVIAGGGAFSISPAAILKNLDIKYGIVGEGEEPMRQFLEAFPDDNKISRIPNMVFQRNNRFHVNPKLPYSFKKNGTIIERETKFNYAYETAGLPV